MERQENGWMIYVVPNEAQSVEGACWKAYTINNDVPSEIGFGDTANEAVGDLVGLLTIHGAATIREIHTRDSQGNTLYPIGR